MMDPNWFDPLFPLRDSDGTAKLSTGTRHMILDSTQARMYSLLAAMNPLCGLPVQIDDSIPDGQVLIVDAAGATLHQITLAPLTA